MRMNGITITVLADNRAAYGLEAEHGLSFWIETTARKILFDTGRGDALPRNVDALGIDVGAADDVVLSHGHYDHTGNVGWAFDRARHATLHTHPEALRTRYSIHEAPKPIGMPDAARETVLAWPEARHRWVTEPQELAPGVWLSGPVPRETAFEDTGGPFYLDATGTEHDLIPDDLSLGVQTQAGLVVCLGCCHAGIVNTLRHLTRVAGEPRVLAVVGGMHLLHASSERLKKTAGALKEYAVPFLYPGHCTGDEAVAFLEQQLGPSVQACYAGMKVGF